MVILISLGRGRVLLSSIGLILEMHLHPFENYNRVKDILLH